jgi:signal transduction histidine kinase
MSVNKANRRQVSRPPVGQAVLALLGTALVTSGVCVLAATKAPAGQRELVAWSSGIAAALLCVAATVGVYGLYAARHYRRQIDELNIDIKRLTDDAIPAVIGRLRAGDAPDSALAEAPQPTVPAHQSILATLATEIGKGERMRAAAMAACANAAGRVQALATRMLADLREMQNRHDETVLGDLMKLDHSTAQAGRLADSIAVLTGGRSGRRWTKPIVMESVLRGALGRINAYQRVQVHAASNVAVVGYAAEGVMHALAELMDNATSFSPPSEQVHVYVEEVHAGVVVTIEDAGLVMSQAALRRAETAVSADSLDLTTLSGTRLGLAVVGSIARKHGLTVSFRPSARGGTGVVVMIPRQLITEPRSNQAAPSRNGTASIGSAGRSGAAIADGPTVGDRPIATEQIVLTGQAELAEQTVPSGRSETARNAESETDVDLDNLPKRQRGETLASTWNNASRPAPTTPTRPRADAAARFDRFRQASRGQGATGNASASEEDTR